MKNDGIMINILLLEWVVLAISCGVCAFQYIELKQLPDVPMLLIAVISSIIIVFHLVRNDVIERYEKSSRVNPLTSNPPIKVGDVYFDRKADPFKNHLLAIVKVTDIEGDYVRYEFGNGASSSCDIDIFHRIYKLKTGERT